MNECIKCGSDDINTTYVARNGFITSSWEKSKGTPDKEFLYYSEYDFYYKVTAEKEHLHKHCRNCQYSWRENTKDTK